MTDRIEMEPFLKDAPASEPMPSFVNVKDSISDDLGIVPGER
jgi:hypothetical protein